MKASQAHHIATYNDSRVYIPESVFAIIKSKAEKGYFSIWCNVKDDFHIDEDLTLDAHNTIVEILCSELKILGYEISCYQKYVNFKITDINIKW